MGEQRERERERERERGRERETERYQAGPTWHAHEPAFWESRKWEGGRVAGACIGRAATATSRSWPRAAVILHKEKNRKKGNAGWAGLAR